MVQQNDLYRIMLPGNAKRRYSQGASFPAGWILELCAELLGSTITWAVLCTQLSTEQQRAVWFADGSSTVRGQHPVWKAAAFKTGRQKDAY